MKKTIGDVVCQNPLGVLDEFVGEEKHEQFLCMNCPCPTWNQEVPHRRLGRKPMNPEQFCDAECEGEFSGKMMYVDGRYLYPNDIEEE